MTQPTINDDMTLDEKLDAIDRAIKAAQQSAEERAKTTRLPVVAPDPAELTMCEGCQ